jgi:hypothetical protein
MCDTPQLHELMSKAYGHCSCSDEKFSKHMEEGGMGPGMMQGDGMSATQQKYTLLPNVNADGSVPGGDPTLGGQQEEMMNPTFPLQLLAREETIRREEYAPALTNIPHTAAPVSGNMGVKFDNEERMRQELLQEAQREMRLGPHEEDSPFQHDPLTPEGRAAQAQRAAMPKDNKYGKTEDVGKSAPWQSHMSGSEEWHEHEHSPSAVKCSICGNLQK